MTPARRAVDYRVDPFDLRLFDAVVEHGTITAAARSLGLSLGAASERIAALEHRVGTQLLARAKAGTTVTDAGRALARRSHRVLAELDALHVEMAAFGRGLRGTVRLLANTAALAEALPARLGAFLREHPDIDVEVQELPSDAVLEALRRGAAEVGIVADHVDTSGLRAEPWRADELVVLRPMPRRRTAAPAALRYAELLEQPFVGLAADAGLSRFLLAQAARGGRVPRHRTRVASFDAVARIVDAGVGVAVMPRSAAERWRGPATQIVALADAWAQRTLLLCSTDRAEALPGVASLIEALRVGTGTRR